MMIAPMPSGREAHARSRVQRLRVVLAVVLVMGLAASTGANASAQPQPDEASRVRSLVAAGQLDRASAVVDAWTARYPEDLDARAWHARLLAWTNRWSEAEAAYRELLVRVPNDVDLIAGLADVLAWQRRQDEALELIDRACLLDAARVDVHLRRAKILEQLGMTEEARALYNDALAREPGSAEAAQGLARLRRPGKFDARIGTDIDHVDETGNGGVFAVYFGTRWNERWNTLAAVAQYQRFGEAATRVAGEATRRFHGGDVLTFAAAIAPDQGIVPVEELQAEYTRRIRLGSRGPVRGLEASWQQRSMWYQDANVQMLTPGFVMYLPKDWIWLVRVSANRVGVAGAGSVWKGSGWTRLTIPLHPTFDAFVLAAFGTENYGYRDQILGFTAETGGAGVRWRLASGQDLSGYAQYQHRSNGQTQISVGTSYGIRF
jgi:YaiO family outer membrane protein